MALFGNLSDKLQQITRKFGGKTRLTEQDIDLMMREIRLALLDADVSLSVVKEFIADVKAKAYGQEVLESLSPGQQVVKIVRDSLTALLGEAVAKLSFAPSAFTVIMLYGLQGSGKTSTAAKLALHLKKNGKQPLLCSVDTHRPAAALQLEILAKSINVPCFIQPEEKDAVQIAQAAVKRAQYLMSDVLIVDTAGRQIVDADLMHELQAIDAAVKPTERLLVVDAMLGQEAVKIWQAFDAAVGVSGFIMTKLDGDARGGAALSVYSLSRKPIKFVTTGEKVDALEEFHPDRMAQRILGMGDVLSLIDKVTTNIDQNKLNATLEDLQQNKFNLETMLTQFEQIKKMGSLKDIVGMLPGVNAGKIDEDKLDDKIIDYNIAIIRSMTPKERRNPNLLDASRRKRIAAGSGRPVSDINRLVKQYEQTSKMMKQLGMTGAKSSFFGSKKNKAKRSFNPFKNFGSNPLSPLNKEMPDLTKTDLKDLFGSNNPFGSGNPFGR